MWWVCVGKIKFELKRGLHTIRDQKTQTSLFQQINYSERACVYVNSVMCVCVCVCVCVCLVLTGGFLESRMWRQCGLRATVTLLSE